MALDSPVAIPLSRTGLHGLLEHPPTDSDVDVAEARVAAVEGLQVQIASQQRLADGG